MFNESPFTPYDFQEKPIEKIVKELKTNDKATAVFPCGYGKTLVSWFVQDHFNPEVCVFFAPSISLVKQSAYSFERQDRDAYQIAVCSDANSLSDDQKKKADLIEQIKEIKTAKITTNEEELSNTITRARNSKDIKKVVIFSTYHSSEILVKTLKKLNIISDFAIYDEAHRVGLPDSAKKDLEASQQEEIKKFYHSHNLEAKKKLFLTATPTSYMTKEVERFGRISERISFKEAIEKGILNDYEVRISIIELESNVLYDDSKYKYVASLFPEMIESYQKETSTKRMSGIAYSRTIHRSEESSTTFSEYRKDEYLSKHISHRDNASDKKQKLKWLEDNEKDVRWLFNARCLTEGVDVKSLNAVCFLDTKHSKTDIIQAVGRSLRKSKKQEGKSIVFVPIGLTRSELEATEKSLDSIAGTEYDTVASVLYHLSEVSEVIVTEFIENKVKCEFLRPSRNLYQSKEEVVVNAHARVKKILETLALEKTYGKKWLKIFNDLKNFLDKNKGYPNSHSKNPEERSLGAWAANQRTVYKKSKLDQQRVAKLESLPGWMWDSFQGAWGKNFRELKDFLDTNKDYPSAASKNLEERSLRGWVKIQRAAYKKSKLDQQRVAQLESLPDWMWDALEETWDKNFGELSEFLDNNKGYPKEGSKNPEERSLGAWVSMQRKAYKKSNLDQQKVSQLESLPGWMWDVLQETWDKNFRNLSGFLDKDGGCPNLYSKNLEERSLGRWIVTQRTAYKKSKLDQQKVARLESLAGWVWVWNKNKIK